MEGPRGLRREELPSLRRLTDICFSEGHMDRYPQLFNEDNLENLRVIVDGSQVISHVGMTEQWASVLGCKLRVACIGSVCTYPEYRRRGLATQLFNNACEKAHADGVDFMMVSGDGGLYRQAGCRAIVGCDFEVSVTPEHLLLLTSSSFTIETCGEGDLMQMAAIYRGEPVRFLRRREDYERAFACRHVMGRQSDFLMVKKDGFPRSYVILPRPSKERRKVLISEYAGERASLVDSLGLIVQRYDLEELGVHILGCDVLLKSLLEERGFQPRPSDAAGTVRIVNFPQLMERMCPYFEEIIGYKRAGRLRFLKDGRRFLVTYGADQVVIPDRSEAAQLLFGNREGPAERLPAGGGVSTLLREVLPIPTPWYGINFV